MGSKQRNSPVAGFYWNPWFYVAIYFLLANAILLDLSRIAHIYWQGNLKKKKNSINKNTKVTRQCSNAGVITCPVNRTTNSLKASSCYMCYYWHGEWESSYYLDRIRFYEKVIIKIMQQHISLGQYRAINYRNVNA